MPVATQGRGATYVVRENWMVRWLTPIALPLLLAALAGTLAKRIAWGTFDVALFGLAVAVADGLLVTVLWFRSPSSIAVEAEHLDVTYKWLRRTRRLSRVDVTAGWTDIASIFAGATTFRDRSGAFLFRLWPWMMWEGERLVADLGASKTPAA